MIVEESARENVAREKRLASTVKYNEMEVTIGETCRRILIGIPYALQFVREEFAAMFDSSLAERKHALVNVKALHR